MSTTSQSLRKKGAGASALPLNLCIQAMGYDPEEPEDKMMLPPAYDPPSVEEYSVQHSEDEDDRGTRVTEKAGNLKRENTDAGGRRAHQLLATLADGSSSMHSDQSGVDSFSMFVDSTPLFSAIHKRAWNQCLVFLGKDSGENSTELPAEEQVRTWVSLYRTDGMLLSRRLPIHEALCNGAPSDLLYALLQLHPLSVETRDYEGNLPLHLAMANNAERVVIEMILQEYPLAMEATNANGKLPLECVNNDSRKVRHGSPLRGEVLQRYVTSAKEVASQQVPKLKDKLFEVNKTIEAAKSELRLAKVELSMIKQQEKMRLENKEKEESRMKEEVMRLRSELESLRCQQEQLCAEKEHWTEKAKIHVRQGVIEESKSDDSKDSQRSWIAMEFSEMVSELEQTTQGRHRSSPRLRHTPLTISSYGHQSTRVPRSWTPTTERFTFREELDSFKKAQQFEIKEAKTEATEASHEYRDTVSVHTVERGASRDSGDSHASIRSIREQLEKSRKRLDNRSNSEDKDDDDQSQTSVGHRNGQCNNDGDSRHPTGVLEQLEQSRKRLGIRSHSEDRDDDAEKSQQSAGQRNGQCSDGDNHSQSGRLVELDARLSGVLSNTCNKNRARDEEDKLDGVISEKGASEGEERHSDGFEYKPDAAAGSLAPTFQSPGSDGESTGGVGVAPSSKNSRFSLAVDNEELQGDIETFSSVLDHIPKSALSGPDENPISDNVLGNTTGNQESDAQESLGGDVADKEYADRRKRNFEYQSSLLSSGTSNDEIGLPQDKTNTSELEKGLALLSPMKSSSARWKCTSMADDLTWHDDDDGEDQDDEDADDEQDSEDEDITLNTDVMLAVTGTLDSSGRQERTLSNGTEHLADGYRDDEASDVDGPYQMLSRRNVSFAEESIVYEETRDDFSPQFSKFDDVVDRAMSRIATKTGASNSQSSRNRRHSHSRKGGRKRQGLRLSSKKDMRHLCITGEDNVEILSSELRVVQEHARSSASISGTASVHSAGDMYPSGSEAGYHSEMY